MNKNYPVSVQIYTPNLIHATRILKKTSIVTGSTDQGVKINFPSSIALVPFLEFQAIRSYKRPNFGGTSNPSPFCKASATFQGIHKNADPATTFDIVSCLRSLDTAIHENKTFATWEKADPARKNRCANRDTLKKLPSLIDEIDPQQIILRASPNGEA